jgi:hypothetical protein
MINLINERILLIYQHLLHKFNTGAITTLNIYDEKLNRNTLEFSINGKILKITITQDEIFSDEDTFNIVLDRFIADAQNQL